MHKISIFIFSVLSLVFAQHNEEFEVYLQELAQKFEVEQIVADSLNTTIAILLDTREKEEYEVSHIPGAVWVGYDDFEISRVDTLDRKAEIVVYCSVGYRSSKIAQKLIEEGFDKVKNLYGGVFKWANENRQLVNDSTSTNYIHTYNRKWGRFITNPQLIKVN